MGLMDKVKTQATQIADKAQQVGQTGQAKLAEVQAKRKADGLLLELGGLVFSDKAGRPALDSEARTAEIITALKEYEAEHGALKVTGAGTGGDA